MPSNLSNATGDGKRQTTSIPIGNGGMLKSRHPMALFLRCLHYVCPYSRKPTCLFSLIALMLLLFTFVPLFRNKVLYPVWPNAWRELGTIDVIYIKMFTETKMNVDATVTCSSRQPPPVSKTSLDRTKIKSYPNVQKMTLRKPEHQRFLPILTDQEKVDQLYAYLIVAEIFKKADIEFFFVEGSMLGAQRHHGFVPWDDDIDIAVNVTQWQKVRDLLSCIQGYVLMIRREMHWKFFANNTTPRYGFPFVDIFFYTENDEYLWAVTHYLAQTVIFAKKDIFPLTTAEFEGLEVPVPKNSDRILRMLFDYEICQSPSSNHKTSKTFSRDEMSNILCSSLTYLYDMYHLKY